MNRISHVLRYAPLMRSRQRSHVSRIIRALHEHASARPTHAALFDETTALSYAELLAAVRYAAGQLKILKPRVVGLFADNGIPWAIADLATLLCGITLVPVPSFFSPAQLEHVLHSAGIDCVLTDQPERFTAAGTAQSPSPFYGDLVAIRVDTTTHDMPALPDGTQKITFTSGTTDHPKGVCLGLEEMEATADSLRIASAASADDRHLCVLPLAMLLENIGGLHTPILAGATVCLPKLASVGLSGSSNLDIGRMIQALATWRASSIILIPQMLQALVGAGRAGIPLPDSLRYIAVGGAVLSAALLDAAAGLGLPVYQGYGLSECASVVAVNRPDANRLGSVGRPLPHVQVSFAQDGEILVRGVRWRGYLGHAPSPAVGENMIATGDLGYLDTDGYLYLTGRKKNIFITSFGRNIAPEWIESELVARPPILQAAVFGESRPFNIAVIFAAPDAAPTAIDNALDAANLVLPDYARVHAWIRATEPFNVANGLATANGRLRRDAIFAAYAERIDAHYSHELATVV
ncbi:MAG: AMP-binding protein [Rhodanobacter sp.]|jgi:long-subunit acyl-CoA synthetase (AMP-forming)|nr:AMP-binding protein [Rhodanobacter sp.]